MRKKKQSTQKKFTFNLIRGFFRGHAPSASLQTAHVCIGSGGRDIKRGKEKQRNRERQSQRQRSNEKCCLYGVFLLPVSGQLSQLPDTAPSLSSILLFILLPLPFVLVVSFAVFWQSSWPHKLRCLGQVMFQVSPPRSTHI